MIPQLLEQLSCKISEYYCHMTLSPPPPTPHPSFAPPPTFAGTVLFLQNLPLCCCFLAVVLLVFSARQVQEQVREARISASAMLPMRMGSERRVPQEAPPRMRCPSASACNRGRRPEHVGRRQRGRALYYSGKAREGRDGSAPVAVVALCVCFWGE